MKIWDKSIRIYQRTRPPKKLLFRRCWSNTKKPVTTSSFCAFSPQADTYYRQLEQRRLNPHHHVRKIVALSDIYGQEAIACAMANAVEYSPLRVSGVAPIIGAMSLIVKLGFEHELYKIPGWSLKGLNIGNMGSSLTCKDKRTMCRYVAM